MLATPIRREKVIVRKLDCPLPRAPRSGPTNDSQPGVFTRNSPREERQITSWSKCRGHFGNSAGHGSKRQANRKLRRRGGSREEQGPDTRWSRRRRGLANVCLENVKLCRVQTGPGFQHLGGGSGPRRPLTRQGRRSRIPTGSTNVHIKQKDRRSLCALNRV